MVVLKGGCAFWVLLIPESARASHFASFGGCFAHFYVIPGLTWYLVCVFGGWDGISEMLLCWGLGVVLR